MFLGIFSKNVSLRLELKKYVFRKLFSENTCMDKCMNVIGSKAKLLFMNVP